MEDKIQKTLKFTILYMAVLIFIVDGLIIFADSMQKYPTIIWALIVTGSSASTLGIIALFRHGLHGVHGKSYLFLTLGLMMWLTADITLAYYYYGFGIEEQKLVSFTDFFWILGYVFLSLHLITILRMLRKKINFKIIIVPTIATALLIIFNITSLTPQELTQEELEAFVITIAYPILDLSLIIPSALILVNFWRDYQQSIPWFLSSLSLLVNAIADDGYVRDFVNHNVHNLWFWDLFYVADFIIMAGALYWYNRFLISSKLINNKRNY